MTAKSKGHSPFAWTVTDDIKKEDLGQDADADFFATGVPGFNFKHTSQKHGPKRKTAELIDRRSVNIHYVSIAFGFVLGPP